jgi:shikimate dehydrogenase
MTEISHIRGDTSLYLVIGDPITHTNSPRMHNAAYRAAGINSIMTAARVTLAALPDAISGMKALGIRGLACTMPLKTAICSLVDNLDPVARSIGAVNTVTNSDGMLTGYNTDWIGIQRPLEKRISLARRRVAILGAGGAAQAAIYACRMRGAEVCVFNRTESKAANLAAKFGVTFAKLDEATGLRDFEIVINTTPLGMADSADCSPLTLQQLNSNQVIFETIYSPRETKLLQLAAHAGCQIIYGWEMFLEQGAAQFEILTNTSAPRDVMQTALQTKSPNV